MDFRDIQANELIIFSQTLNAYSMMNSQNITFHIAEKEILKLTPDGIFIGEERVEDKNKIYDAMCIFYNFIGKPWHQEVDQLSKEFPEIDPTEIVNELRRLLKLKVFL